MKIVKPIETKYNGNFFRSRAEARWALFFDELNIKYIYEPEGFTFSDGTRYLPDFYLPESDSFFEVKGIMSDYDMHKIQMLIKECNKPCTIGYADFTFVACDNWGSFGANEEGFVLSTKERSILAECAVCHKYFFCGDWGSYACQCCGAYDGNRYMLPIMLGDLSPWWKIEDKVKSAIEKAKQARFEYPVVQCKNGFGGKG